MGVPGRQPSVSIRQGVPERSITVRPPPSSSHQVQPRERGMVHSTVSRSAVTSSARTSAEPKEPSSGAASKKKTARRSGRHSIYVVLLDTDVLRDKKARDLNPLHHPARPCVYVGMTGTDPETRFAQHKKGYRASRYVRRFGVRLLPALSAGLTGLTYQRALAAEAELAEALREEGYFVTGGH